MTIRTNDRACGGDVVSSGRRRALQAIGAGVATGILGSCATPQLPPRPLDAALAPRAGDTWQYGYRSDWANVAPRAIVATVVRVTNEGVLDRVALAGSGAPGSERLFTSRLEIVDRALSGVDLHTFSPYLQAFGPLPAPGERLLVAMPPPDWGTRWTATARVSGTEPVSVPAGTFDATRVDILGTRTYLVGQMDDASDPVWMYAVAWFAPAVKRLVRFSYQTQAVYLNPLARDHFELLSYRVA